jgi:hypothetical protein
MHRRYGGTVKEINEYPISQQVDAIWIIGLCIAIHGGELPQDWAQDSETHTMALELAGRLAERYGRANDLDSMSERLAQFGIRVEMKADDCTGISTPNNGDPVRPLRLCFNLAGHAGRCTACLFLTPR